MTDQLDKLKQVFEAEAEIKASSRAKKTAMNAAMQAFEKQHETSQIKEQAQENNQKTETNFQGNLVEPRQKGQDSYFVKSQQQNADSNLSKLTWRKRLMKLSYLFPVAAAGALAVSVLVLNPTLLNNTESELASQNAKLNNNVRREKATALGATQKEKRDNGANMINADLADSAEEAAPMVEQMMTNADTSINAQLAKPAPIAPMKKKMIAQGAMIANDTAGTMFYEPEAPSFVPGIKQGKEGRDKFESIKTNPLKLTEKEPVSTFSIDVDTASYSFMRAALNRNVLPQKDAVRVEELINYFPYDYAQPTDTDQPFKVSTTVMPTPWNANTKLLHIGIKGYQLPKQETPKSNLVFLLDTSGSMGQPNKLPLLINSFKLLLSTLKPDDTVSIVTYAGSAGTVLEPTKVKEKAKIIQALERLNAGGSTAGGEGIRLAYQLAEANYDKKAVNRVILATDGDFNVGISNREELKSFIERKRKSGVFLSVLGFGMGNYNDVLMQTLAQNGNGNAAYIDSLSEARKVLVEEASSTLFTIAKDVKIQVEFNPKAVSQYRLIGYETRALKREDFNNDKVDAGEIGAGHTVTAIYEITPTGAESKLIEPLRYANQTSNKDAEKATEYGFLKLRYKLPDEDKSKLIEIPLKIADTKNSINEASRETRFATAVAAFGQLLRGGTYLGNFSYDDVIKLAQNAKGEDPFGYRAEFINLVRLAKTAQAMR